MYKNRHSRMICYACTACQKKPRRVRRRSGEKIEIIFCRGVCVAENTLRLANVGVVC